MEKLVYLDTDRISSSVTDGECIALDDLSNLRDMNHSRAGWTPVSVRCECIHFHNRKYAHHIES